VSLVTKVKDTANEAYRQAKSRYADSDAMRNATKQAGHMAGQVADRVKDAADRATAAVKDARARGAARK
jgi:hypothetical protein